MLTLNWDSNSKIKSGGILTRGILTGGFLNELESNFYVTNVLLDADYYKINEKFLGPTFKLIFGHIRDM